MKDMILKPGRERSVRNRHPWNFSGAVSHSPDNAKQGETIRVLSSKNEPLALAAYAPASAITARVWTLDAKNEIGRDFLRNRIERALDARTRLGIPDRTTAWRVVAAEADGLPGFTVDRYGDFLVCQITSAGAQYWKDTLVELLRDTLTCKGIYSRAVADSARKEGIEISDEILTGDSPPETVEISENGLLFLVNIHEGHKTGFYIDQRDNRVSVAAFSAGLDVLNCFSYTGAFSAACLKSGASHVTEIEESAEALALSATHTDLNQLDSGKMERIQGDAFKVLRQMRDQGRAFDMIILDPPKFAASKSQLPGACRGYKDINLLAAKLLRPGGILVTFSCSAHMTPDLFAKIVCDALLDAGRDAHVLHHLFQAQDHPVVPAFPESLYLKGLAIRVW